MLLVVTNVVSVVATFLCTRRCYIKKSSRSLSPGGDYETVELDGVKMQPSPAYVLLRKQSTTDV